MTPGTEIVDPLLAALQYAAGVPAPIRLDVRSEAGTVTRVDTNAPFVVIGRGTTCDVKLGDQQVSFRHVYLQAIGSRIACIDLFTGLGINWTGPEFVGWMTPEHRLQIAGYEIKLADDCWFHEGALKTPTEFRPRDEQALEYGVLPRVEIELLNTTAQGKRWPINRVITLVGREDRCRISVSDERISRVHCSLLLLPTGLWVIDLLGKGGVQVNGQSVRCGMLSEGTELSLGPYRMTAHYPDFNQQASHAAEHVALTNAMNSTEREFVTRQNRFFIVENWQDTLIISPTGNGRSIFYQDMHRESSRVSDVINSRKYRHLVIDLGAADSLGKPVLEALAAMCRGIPGNSVFCNATPETYAELEAAGLAKIWLHYLSRNDALLAVQNASPA